MKKRCLKIWSIFMVVVFLYGITPREYVHDLFAHHHDTEEPQLKKGEQVISTRHTHCSFLGIDFGPFVSSERQYFVFETIIYPAARVSCPAPHSHFFTTYKKRSLRGPPAAVTA